MLIESQIYRFYRFKNSDTDDETDAWLNRYGQVIENSVVHRWAYIPSERAVEYHQWMVWRDPRLMRACAWVFTDGETYQKLVTNLMGGEVTGKWYLVNKYDLLPYTNAPIF